MKKIYEMPEIYLEEMELQQMIALSLTDDAADNSEVLSRDDMDMMDLFEE